MPVQHPVTGEWAAGMGSVGVSRETNQTVIPHAGSACWLGDRLFYQREIPGVHAWLEADGVEIDSQGANRVFAGGDVWAAWLDGVGYRDSHGNVNAAWNVGGVAPDGTIAVILDRSEGLGIQLLAPDGEVIDLPTARPDGQNVTVITRSTAVWTEQGHRVICSTGVSDDLELLTYLGFWVTLVQINSAWLICYQDEHDRLIAHRPGQSVGKVLARGNTFRPDISTTGRVVYAVNEGELPQDIRAITPAEFFALPDVDLRPGVKPPAPPVQPPVEPPKEPPVSTEIDQTPTELDRAIAAALQVERDKYPHPLPLPTTDEGRRMLGRIINDAAYAVRTARGLGKLDVCLEGKDDENTAIQPVTDRKVAKDIIQTVENGVRCGRDFLAATGAGEASIVFGTKGRIPEGKESVEAVPPAGVPAQPPIDPPPVQPPPPSNIEVRLTALEARVLALEQRPQPVPPPPGLPPTVPPAADGAATEATLRELVELIKGALAAFGR